jgi:hemoglobin
MRHPSLTRLAMSAVLAAALAALGGCAMAPQTPPTLYERLGGAPTMDRVVSRLVDRAAADVRMQRSFDGVKLPALKKSIAQQFCNVAGGGCVYEGETMANAHRDLKITDSEFDALVALLREELDRAHVPPSAKNELLRLLAPMKRDIVAGAAGRV